MHTWDTVDANTASWHGNKICNTNMLSQEQKNLLIPEDMYEEIVNIIKSKTEDITYL